MPLDIPDHVDVFVDANIFVYHFSGPTDLTEPCTEFPQRIAEARLSARENLDSQRTTRSILPSEEEMTKKCKTCGQAMYQDDQGHWFCPDCILDAIDPAFLDEERDERGELKRPYVLEPPTKQVSIRLPVTDLELAKRLGKRKGIPKYQSYIKTLLHEALVKEAGQGRVEKRKRAV